MKHLEKYWPKDYNGFGGRAFSNASFCLIFKLDENAVFFQFLSNVFMAEHDENAKRLIIDDDVLITADTEPYLNHFTGKSSIGVLENGNGVGSCITNLREAYK